MCNALLFFGYIYGRLWICYLYSLLVSRDSRLKKRRQFCKHMSEISSLTHPANQIWSIWLWFQTWYFPRIVARLHCPRWPGVTRGTLQERRPPRRTRERARLPTSRLLMQGWRKSKGWPGTVINLADLCCDWWLHDHDIAETRRSWDRNNRRRQRPQQLEGVGAVVKSEALSPPVIIMKKGTEWEIIEDWGYCDIRCENESYYIVINKL